MTQTTGPGSLPADRSREVFAWAMYDWANSAYSTLSITILVAYLQKVVLPGESEAVVWGVPFSVKWGPVVWAWGISLSMLVAAVLSPILGAMADANASKRRWLAATALSGAAVAVGLALVSPHSAWLVVLLFVIMSLLFELSLGFYNGFLPEIADEGAINRVSAWGYALGYLGGALALVLALLVLQFGHSLGIPDKVVQLRVGILIMGLWWGVFTLPTLWVLRDRGRPPDVKKPMLTAAGAAVSEVGNTLRNIRLYKMLALFLLGFLFYNDGIQTVISQSSTFALEDLHFTETELIYLVLLIQIVALPGAILVGRLADLLGQKPTLMICLAVWVGLVATAFFIHAKWQFWILGAILALVLGGTQSVSRAIMGRMTPPEHAAEFFGFFNLSGKATSFLGTFLFGLIIWLTGSARLAIVSLLLFFLVGWAIVARINIENGRRQALAA